MFTMKFLEHNFGLQVFRIVSKKLSDFISSLVLFYRIFLLIFTLEKATSDIRKGVKSKYISTLFLFKFRVANRQKNKPKITGKKRKKRK